MFFIPRGVERCIKTVCVLGIFTPRADIYVCVCVCVYADLDLGYCAEATVASRVTREVNGSTRCWSSKPTASLVSASSMWSGPVSTHSPEATSNKLRQRLMILVDSDLCLCLCCAHCVYSRCVYVCVLSCGLEGVCVCPPAVCK